MGAAPPRRPASRWQLLHRSWLPTNWRAYVPGSRKICSPNLTTSPNLPAGMALSEGGWNDPGLTVNRELIFQAVTVPTSAARRTSAAIFQILFLFMIYLLPFLQATTPMPPMQRCQIG